MANTKLIFYGCCENTFDSELECYATNQNEINVSIEMGNNPPSIVTVDKSTAIKFAKTLRTEINKIKQIDV